MKIEKLNLDGKKTSIEVLDRIFSGNVNKTLVNNVLYKTNGYHKHFLLIEIILQHNTTSGKKVQIPINGTHKHAAP